MFRQIKSAIIWSYIYRFRKFLAKLLLALLLLLLLQFFYVDLLDYLKMTHRTSSISYTFVAKWFLFFIIALYIYVSFKKELKSKHTEKSQAKKSIKKMSKKEISNLADSIIQSKLERKQSVTTKMSKVWK